MYKKRDTSFLPFRFCTFSINVLICHIRALILPISGRCLILPYQGLIFDIWISSNQVQACTTQEKLLSRPTHPSNQLKYIQPHGLNCMVQHLGAAWWRPMHPGTRAPVAIQRLDRSAWRQGKPNVGKNIEQENWPGHFAVYRFRFGKWSVYNFILM